MPDEGPLIPRWFIISAAVILFVPLLTFILNHTAVRELLIHWLKANEGIEVSSLRIHLVPRPSIEVSDLVVRNDQRPDAVLQAHHGFLRLRLLSLLRQRLAAIRLVVKAPHIVVLRDREGSWLVPWARHGPPREHEAAVHVKWLLPNIELTGGQLLFIDEYQHKSPRIVTFTDVNGVVDSDLSRTMATVAVTGTLEDSPLSISGSLFLQQSDGSVRFDGSIDIQQFDLATWIGSVNGSSTAEPRVRQTDVTAEIVLLAGTTGYEVTFSRFEARLDWVTLRGHGVIEASETAPRYVATVSATPVSVAALLQEMPPGLLQPKLRTALVEHRVSGVVELLSATLGGFAAAPRPDVWNGTARLSQATAQTGVDGQPVNSLSATVFFDLTRVEALDISGTVGGLRVADGKFTLTQLETMPMMDVSLHGDGEVQQLLSLFHGLSEGTASETVLKTFTDPHGEINLSIHASGPLAPKPHVELVNAEIGLHGLGAYLPRLRLSAEHLHGTVGINKHSIEFKHLKGHFGSMSFQAAGRAVMDSNPRFENVAVELSVDGHDLTAMLSPVSSLDPGSFQLGGLAHAALRLSGPLSSLEYNGEMDLGEVSLQVPPVLHKNQHVPTSLEFEGRWVPGQRLSVRRMALLLPSARIDGHADIDFAETPGFTVGLKAGPLNLNALAGELSLGPLAEGLVHAALTVKGQGSDWRAWTTTGRVEVREANIIVPGYPDRIHDFSFASEISGRDLLIQRLSFRLGESDISGTGFVKHWASRPNPTLLLDSSKLDLSPLLMFQSGNDSKGSVLEQFHHWLTAGRADVTATIGQARYRTLLFRRLAVHLHLDPGRLDLEILKGRTPNGRVSGKLTASASPSHAVAIEGNLSIDGMPVEHMVGVFDPQSRRLKGLLSLHGGVRGTMEASGSFLTTFETLAPLRISLTDGRVLQGTVLPKVLKILNVPAILEGEVDLNHGGIPFDRVSVTVNVRKGVVASEDVFFDSPIVKVTGAGTLTLSSNELDLALAVSPLGAYSHLIDKIPLFGQLLEGDRPGFSTALFQVKGSLRNPDVQYLPLESIANGVTGYPRLALDVLRNVVMLPEKILMPDMP